MVVVYHRFYCTAVYHRFYSCDYSCALFLASLQESNKGKSFEHTNLDTGGFLGQGISGKIYIGKSRMKVSPTAKMWRRTPKCSRQLTKQKNGFFCKSSLDFRQFFKVSPSFSGCGRCRGQISPGCCSLVDNEGNLKV